MDDLEGAAGVLAPLHEDFLRLLQTLDDDTTIGFASDVSSYYDHHLTTADAKAGSVIALALPVAGVILHFTESGWREGTRWVGVAGIFVGVLCALLALQPRRGPGHRRPLKGFIFWEHLAPYSSSAEYGKALAGLDVPGILAAYAEQHFAIASILRKKYFWLHYSVPALVGGLAVAGVGYAFH